MGELFVPDADDGRELLDRCADIKMVRDELGSTLMRLRNAPEGAAEWNTLHQRARTLVALLGQHDTAMRRRVDELRGFDG
jgi:hypothetical protein